MLMQVEVGMWWSDCGMQLYLWGGKIASTATMPELSLQIDQLPGWLATYEERRCTLVINKSEEVEALALGELNIQEVREGGDESPGVTTSPCKVMALRPIIDAFTETRKKLFSFPTYEYVLIRVPTLQLTLYTLQLT